MLVADADAPDVISVGAPDVIGAAVGGLTSALVLEPADMSLAGPVAEVSEIFSSSNSTGPTIEKIHQILF